MKGSLDEVKIYCDGASRGNPGPAAAGALLSDSQGAVLAEVSARLGTTTNNVAEYSALLLALEKAKALGAQRLQIFADSQLLIRQVCGQYKVKNPVLLQFCRQALKRLAFFQAWQASHVPRELNKAADRLANLALDHPEGSGLVRWEELIK